MATAAALSVAALVALALRRRLPAVSALVGLGAIVAGYALARWLNDFLL